MKKLILTALAATSFAAANAQKVDDTVYLGASYANQVWYSLPNDEQGSAPKNNWDLAFDATGFGSTIYINSVTGTTLWAYPKSDLSGWATVDTTGLYTWTPRYNADTTWGHGAMGRYADPANSFDLDWGMYNLTTHVVTGDSLYIIKLANGDYKKLAIETLTGNIYSFKYENLDGTSPVSTTLDKSAYAGKNFGYYSIQTDAALTREPATANWDLLFTQYTAFIPQAYTVTGVLANKDMEIAQCVNVTGKDTFVTWKPETYSPYVNIIGYDWKSYTGMTYKIQDSLVYFVARKNGEIWKVIMTGFTGGTLGGSMFSKEKLYTPPPPTVGVNTIIAAQVGLALYPNPAYGQAVNLVYNIETAAEFTKLSVCDVTGKVMMSTGLENTKGLHQFIIPTGNLNKGMYVITVSTNNTTTQQKLVVQ